MRLKKYDKNWDFVGAGLPKSEKLALRAGVRERLLTVFDEAAFSEDADEANGALGSFQRQHLLDWGDRLLAAEAANDATAANLATEAPPPPPPPPSAAEAAAASVANESSDEDSTDTDTAIRLTIESLPEAIRLTIESLPEDTRATVVAIMERAAAEGYELSDWDELLRYARNRFVEAAVLNAGDSESYSRAANELGAVNAAWERVMPPAAPSQFDEHDSKSQAGGESVFSFSGLSFVSRGEALQHLHRDMIDNRVSVDNIPGLKKKKKKKKFKQAGRAIKKSFKKLGKKMGIKK